MSSNINDENIPQLEKDALFMSRQEIMNLAVTFSCGDCCKRVIAPNSTGFTFQGNRVILTAPNFEILTYSGGKLVNMQTSTTNITFSQLDIICTVDFNPTEINPSNFPNIGISPFALEVDCGACCKKVLNVQTITPDVLFTFLTPPQEELVYILTFSNGKIISIQSATRVGVRNTRICTIEQNATEIPIPQPQPTTRGISLFKG